MNLQQLKYFCEIAKTQNMSQSSKHLHVSQPALSSTIKALENELGLSLFDRKGRTIVLNENGAEFLKSVNSIFSILGRNTQKNALIGAGHIEIVIGAIGTDLGLVPYMNHFMTLHSNVTFRTVSHTTVSHMNTDEAVDFLIGTSPQIHQGRETLNLWSSSLSIVYPKTAPIPSGTDFNLAFLRNMRFIFCTPPSIQMPRMYKMCLDAGIQPNCAYITDDRISILAMLHEGNYVAIMPSEDAALFVSCSNKLAMQPFLNQSPDSTDSIVKLSWKKNVELSPAAVAFIEFLQQEIPQPPE